MTTAWAGYSKCVCLQNGVTEDPDELRKLYKDRGNAAIGRFTIQLFLDALACFAVRICDAQVLPPRLIDRRRPLRNQPRMLVVLHPMMDLQLC